MHVSDLQLRAAHRVLARRYLEELERYRDVLTAAAERYHGIVNVDL